MFCALELAASILAPTTLIGPESKLVSKLAASIGSSVTYDVLLEFVPIQTSKAGHIPLFGDVGLRNKDPVTS